VLIEGARTNLLLRSQEFSNAYWIKTRSSIAANATTAPDGTNTAAKLVEDNSTNTHKLESTAFTSGLTSGINYAYSVFLKASERTWAVLEVTGLLGAGYAWFNLANGTVGTTINLVSASVQALGNGWYRCTIVDLSTGTGDPATICNIFPATADNVVNYAGDNTSGIFIWGAQLEAASFPSSYVPTVAAASTRAADVLSYTAGVTYPIQLWSEFERVVDTGGSEFLMTLSEGANDSNRSLLMVSASDLARYLVTSGAATQADLTVAGALALNTVYKISARTALNDVQMARGGTLGTQDTSASLPSTPTLITIGSAAAAAASQPFGYIRRIAVIQGAGTDANLEVMTT
jgi:hypothetical protein